MLLHYYASFLGIDLSRHCLHRGLFSCLFVFIKVLALVIVLSFTDINPCWDTCKAQYWSKLEDYLSSTVGRLVPNSTLPWDCLHNNSHTEIWFIYFYIVQNNSCELIDKAIFCSSSAYARLRESISNQMFPGQSLIQCLFLSNLCLLVILLNRTWSSHFWTSSFLCLIADAVLVPSANDTIGWVPSESKASLAYYPANCMKSSVHLASLFIRG